MSDRDTFDIINHSHNGHASARPTNGNGGFYVPPPARGFNPTAGAFQPSNGNYKMTQPKHNQVSIPSHSHLETKVVGLEQEQEALRTDVEDLKTLCNSLHTSVETMKKGGWSVNVGPFKDQSAAQFQKKLDALTREVKGVSDDGHANVNKANTTNGSVQPYMRSSSVASSGDKSVPPHMRGKTGSQNGGSLPPHVRGSVAKGSTIKPLIGAVKHLDVNNRLVTDGHVDTAPFKSQVAELSPPASQASTLRADTPLPSVELTTKSPIESHSTQTTSPKAWLPHFLSNLPTLPADIEAKIPSLSNMTTFHPDFLRNQFGGMTWSPGLNYIPPAPGPCILRNRTYYTLDAHYEPFAPTYPGHHGAKLTAFFNTNPEDELDDAMPEDCTSYENVPLFIMRKGEDGRLRYVYYGHYSQTRWSDKLDYDRMVQCVPKHVREYWAEELSAAGRPEWVTDKLMNHFFRRPEYEGHKFGRSIAEGGSVASEDVPGIEEKVMKDVAKYVGMLREWEKEARMKTSMIKKDFVLQAFEHADADDPPALRLWWEYLVCIDWKADFYHMLTQLQQRNPNYERY